MGLPQFGQGVPPCLRELSSKHCRGLARWKGPQRPSQAGPGGRLAMGEWLSCTDIGPQASGLRSASSGASGRATAPVRTRNTTNNLVRSTHVRDRTSCSPPWRVLEHQDCRCGCTHGPIQHLLCVPLCPRCTVSGSRQGLRGSGVDNTPGVR